MATAGPGITNVITSMANAFVDRTSVLYLTGSAPQPAEDMNQSQAGIDNVGLARAVTKWARRITLPSDIPRLVAEAIRAATSAPTGPVLLDLPFDVSFATVEEGEVPIPDSAHVVAVPRPRPEAIIETLALLAAAQRPVIMAGEGAWQSGAEDELGRFVAATGIPVFAHYQSDGLLPSDHPLYGGSFFKMSELAEPGK
jgi:acetolactate synthase-1/2/3 large subunit